MNSAEQKECFDIFVKAIEKYQDTSLLYRRLVADIVRGVILANATSSTMADTEDKEVTQRLDIDAFCCSANEPAEFKGFSDYIGLPNVDYPYHKPDVVQYLRVMADTLLLLNRIDKANKVFSVKEEDLPAKYAMMTSSILGKKSEKLNKLPNNDLLSLEDTVKIIKLFDKKEDSTTDIDKVLAYIKKIAPNKYDEVDNADLKKAIEKEDSPMDVLCTNVLRIASKYNLGRTLLMFDRMSKYKEYTKGAKLVIGKKSFKYKSNRLLNANITMQVKYDLKSVFWLSYIVLGTIAKFNEIVDADI